MQENKIKFKTVMVIDDNEVDRYIAEEMINSFPFAYNIILKESAKSALEYLNSSLDDPERIPDLIFLDIRMPEIDGFGFLKEYEKLSETIRKKCIIMMLSSSLNKDDEQMALSNQYVKRFLTKPLDYEKLGQL